MQSIIPKGLTDGSVINSVTGGIRGSDTGTSPAVPPDASSSAPLDSDVAALFADRRNRVALFKADGLRSLRAGNYRRAAELCSAWADLELANPEPWRCLGEAQQAQGNHQEAVNAFRKAKQNDPTDRSLDAAIERSQKGIVGDFLHRYRK
jgi:tetratricopeptide (TPR) repeat protein